MCGAPGAGMGRVSHPEAIGERRGPSAPRPADSRAPTAGRVPVRAPLERLPAALEILATRMHDALAARRLSEPGSTRRECADAEVARLNELYLQLQARMEIPDDVWLLAVAPTSAPADRRPAGAGSGATPGPPRAR